MDKKKLREAIAKMLEEKGKRKFTQSAEIIINMRGIDFSKSENRLNLEIALPKGRGGKEHKIAVIAEPAIAAECKKAGADLIILPEEMAAWATKERLKELARHYILLVQPTIMAQAAKYFSQYLGPRGKLPRPLVGNPAELINKMRKTVRIASKGRYLPVAQAFIGTENMSVDELFENAEAVYEAVKAKVNEGNIKSVYVKLTMGKPIKVF
jgi:large subunit ribosomal protein L1